MSLQVDSSPSLRPAPIITARSSSSLGPNTHAKPTSTSATALAPLRYGKALYDFPAKETDELQLEEEDIIAISSIDSKGGWLYGENNGAWGWFPERYVRILNEDEAAGEGLIQTPSSVASSIVTSTPVLSSSATASSTSPVHAAALSDGGVDDDGPGDEAEDATGTLTPSSTFPKSAGVGWFTKKRPKKSKQLSTEEAKSISRAESVVSETGSSGGDVFPVVESRSRMNSAGPVEKHVRVLPPKKGTGGKSLAELVKSGKTVAIVGAPAEMRQTWLDHIGGQEAADRLGISKQERKRQEIVYEILCTERDYVEDLETVIEVYIQQFKKNKLLRPKDLSVVFSNIEAILPINMELLKLLETRQSESENNVVEQVGDIFIRVSDYLKMYAMYCSNHPYAVMKLQALRNAKAIAKFLDQCASMPESRSLGLQHFLLKPIQRICKYPLFLRELIKNTESDHPDSANLIKALLKIETVVTIVNEGARQAEGVHKMLELQNRFVQKVNIVAPSRTMKKSGPLELITNGERKKREIFLFNDMLLVAKAQGSDGEKLKVVAMVPFDMIFVNALPDEPENALLIEIVHVHTAKFTLAADTLTSRQAWMKSLKEATDAWMNMKSRGTGIEIEERSIRNAAITALAERRSEEASVNPEPESETVAVNVEESLSSITTLAIETEQDRTINDLKAQITVTAPVEIQAAPASSSPSPSPQRSKPPALPVHGVPLTHQRLNSSSPSLSPSQSIRNDLTDSNVASTSDLDRPRSPSSRVTSNPASPLISRPKPLAASTETDIKVDSDNSPPKPSGFAHRSHSVRIGSTSSHSLAARIASNHFIVQDLTVRSTPSLNTPSDDPVQESFAHTRASSSQPLRTTPQPQSRIQPQILPRYPSSGIPTSRITYNSDVTRRLVISATVKERQERLEQALQSAPVSLAGTPRASIMQATPMVTPVVPRPRTQSMTDRGVRSVSEHCVVPSVVPSVAPAMTASPTRVAPSVPAKRIEATPSLLSVSVEEEGKPGDENSTGEAQTKKMSVNKPVKKAIILDVVKKAGKQCKDFVYSTRVQYVGIGENNTAVIHHTFEDFFDFHVQLLGHFPEEAGLQIRRYSTESDGDSVSSQGTGRIIPEMPCQMMFVSEAVAKARIGQLQEYIQAIISLPPKISRSPITMQFFRLDGKHAQSLV